MSNVVSHRAQLTLLLFVLCCQPSAPALSHVGVQAVSPHHDSHVFGVRVGFISGKLTMAGNLDQSKIFYKLISVVLEDKDKFEKAVAKS